MGLPSSLIAAAPPSETGLLDFVRARVTREMIHEIAMNNRENDVAEYELAILNQLAPSPVLGFRPWQQSMEVLELERWRKPDSARAHLKRLLACTILLRNVACVPKDEDVGGYFIETSAASVIRLVSSCVAVGDQAARLGIGFLLWVHDKQQHPILRPFVSFGALLLQIQEGLPNLPETCAWVKEDEKLAREQLGKRVHCGKWLIGLNYQEAYGEEDEDDPERPQLWADTLAHVIAVRSGQLPPEVKSALKQMHDRLSG
jgi:hypothetical protein